MKPTLREVQAAILALRKMAPKDGMRSAHAKHLWAYEPIAAAIATGARCVVPKDRIHGPTYAERLELARGFVVLLVCAEDQFGVEDVVKCVRNGVIRELKASIENGAVEESREVSNAAKRFVGLVRKSGLQVNAADREIAEATGTPPDTVAEGRRAWELQCMRTGHYSDVVRDPEGIARVAWSDRVSNVWREDE